MVAKMEKDVFDKIIKRIENTFKGPGGIIGERRIELINIENEIFRKMAKRFNSYACLMDSFFDFHIETFKQCTARRDITLPELLEVVLAIHIPSFWRFRSSYMIFWKGYYIDALSLLRAVFENILQISALKLNIISCDEVRGNLKDEDLKDISEDKELKLIQKYAFKADKKVRSYIIGDKSGLSIDNKYYLDNFLKVLHSSVHKCKLNLLLHMEPQSNTKIHFPVFPKYDENIASLYMNSSWPIAWLFLRTFPLLQLNDSEFSSNWHKKYKVLDEVFEESICSLPKVIEKSFKELAKRKFNFY